MSFDIGPFGSEDAVENGVTHRAVAPGMMMTNYAIFPRAERFDCALRAEVEVIGTQSDDPATERNERVRQQQQFAGGIDAGFLPSLCIPCVTNLNAIDGGQDVVITRASRNRVCGELANCPSQHMTGALPFERGVDVAVRIRRLGYRCEPKSPQLSVGCRSRQSCLVLVTQWLEPDAETLKRDWRHSNH